MDVNGEPSLGTIIAVVVLCVLALPVILILIQTVQKARQEKTSFGKALRSIFPRKKLKTKEETDENVE